jgi:glycosyltransferase involved in cell wall biosynthesis
VISIVMPAYNEASIIEASVREWHDEVIRHFDGAELIVVNDCSTDRTEEILTRLAHGIAWSATHKTRTKWRPR